MPDRQYGEKPPAFLTPVVRELSDMRGLSGMCAGFEDGHWRSDQLANHLLEWLPEFALNETEYANLSGANAMQALRAAAQTVYTSHKYQRRGEFGELLLHAIVRQEFDTIPAISKIFFKDTANETVKGFDAVHVVEGNDGLELWLGEVKFYKDIASAVRDVVKEIDEHTAVPYLRSEFAAIWRKLSNNSPYREQLRPLLENKNKSMDKIFGRLCVPVMLTYESETIAKHSKTTPQYEEEIAKEFKKINFNFSAKSLPAEIKVILILLPLGEKADLIDRFDRKLKGLMQ